MKIPRGRDYKRWRGTDKIDASTICCDHCLIRLKAAEMAVNNYTNEEIATALSMDVRSVLALLGRIRRITGAKIPGSYTGSGNIRVDDEVLEKLTKLIDLGLTYVTIGERLGISYGCVGYWARKIRGPRRRGKKCKQTLENVRNVEEKAESIHKRVQGG